MTKPITRRQQRFVDEYLIDLNATQAAIRAGYSKATAGQLGAQLLKNLKVLSAIQKAQDARSKRTNVTADWVIARLMAEAELTGEGASHAARVTALTQLGRHLGLFEDKVKIGPLTDKDDAELDATIRRLAAEIGAGDSARGEGEAAQAEPAGEISTVH